LFPKSGLTQRFLNTIINRDDNYGQKVFIPLYAGIKSVM